MSHPIPGQENKTELDLEFERHEDCELITEPWSDEDGNRLGGFCKTHNEPVSDEVMRELL